MSATVSNTFQQHLLLAAPLLNNEFWLTGPESITYGGLGEQEDDFTPPDLDSCQSMEDYMK